MTVIASCDNTDCRFRNIADSCILTVIKLENHKCMQYESRNKSDGHALEKSVHP